MAPGQALAPTTTASNVARVHLQTGFSPYIFTQRQLAPQTDQVILLSQLRIVFVDAANWATFLRKGLLYIDVQRMPH